MFLQKDRYIGNKISGKPEADLNHGIQPIYHPGSPVPPDFRTLLGKGKPKMKGAKTALKAGTRDTAASLKGKRLIFLKRTGTAPSKQDQKNSLAPCPSPNTGEASSPIPGRMNYPTRVGHPPEPHGTLKNQMKMFTIWDGKSGYWRSSICPWAEEQEFFTVIGTGRGPEQPPPPSLPAYTPTPPQPRPSSPLWQLQLTNPQKVSAHRCKITSWFHRYHFWKWFPSRVIFAQHEVGAGKIIVLLLQEQVKAEVPREYLCYIQSGWMTGLIWCGNSSLPVAVPFFKIGMPHTQCGKWCGNSEGKSKGKQQGKGDLHGVSHWSHSLCPSPDFASQSGSLRSLISWLPHSEQALLSGANSPYCNS